MREIPRTKNTLVRFGSTVMFGAAVLYYPALAWAIVGVFLILITLDAGMP